MSGWASRIRSYTPARSLEFLTKNDLPPVYSAKSFRTERPLEPDEARGKKCYELIGNDHPCEICATSITYRTKQPARIRKRVEELGGIWLDANEWETLVERNLHDDVHFIYSSAWQRQVAEEKKAQTYHKRIETVLGEQDFARARGFKEWVEAHPQRSTIMAFLTNVGAKQERS